MVYVILFPQLVCVVHYKRHCNTYGSLAAYIVGFLLRALGGENILSLPPIIKYPWYNEIDGQLFPFRTFSMISSFFTLIGVSRLSKWLFETGHLPSTLDIFHCVINIPEDIVAVQEPHEEMTVLSSSQALYYRTSEINGRVNPALDTGDESREKLLNKEAKSVAATAAKVTDERLIRDHNQLTSNSTEIKGMNQIKAMPNIESVSPGQVIITKL